MITIKPVASYYSDDDKAILARKAELAATGKRRQIELAELDAAIAEQGNPNSTPEDTIQNLIAGIEVPRPPPLSERRTALQYVIRDIEQALDYLAGKERQININAGARLAKDIKPQHDAAEKELVDALLIAHQKHLLYWNAKRHLLNNGIGLYGNFNVDADEVLGIPVNGGSTLAEYFRDAVKAGYIQTLPAAFR